MKSFFTVAKYELENKDYFLRLYEEKLKFKIMRAICG